MLNLLHDHENARNRIAALDIMRDLAFRFSKQFLDGFVATDIVSMMQEKNSEVRKRAHETFIALLTLFDRDLVSKKFFDSVKGMAADLNTEIRLIFVDSICLLTAKLPFELFEQAILPKFILNLESKHRFIKEKSLSKLGNLICTINEMFGAKTRSESGSQGTRRDSQFIGMHGPKHKSENQKEEAVSVGRNNPDEIETLKKEFEVIRKKSNYQALLRKYFKLPTLLQKMNYSAQENILRENFKFLGQVVVPLGGESWDMFKSLLNLVENIKPGSLVEICKLAISEKLDLISENLPKAIVENELILIIDKLFLLVGPTTTVKVKLNTLKVFSKVLSRLEPKRREQYADVYHSALQSDMLKWRFRLIIVSQFESLLQLFPLQKVNDFFMPMMIKFCMDECYVVRRNASASFWLLYKAIKESQLEVAKQMIDINFLYFAEYNRFSFRQSFVYMSEGILLNCSQHFCAEAANKLLILSKDPVINVRVCLARLIRAVRQAGTQTEDLWFEKCEENLLIFEDPDVMGILGDKGGRLSKLSVSKEKMSISANSEESGGAKKPYIPKLISTRPAPPPKLEYNGEDEEVNEDEQDQVKGFQLIGESNEEKKLLENTDDLEILSDEEPKPVETEQEEFEEVGEEEPANDNQVKEGVSGEEPASSN